MKKILLAASHLPASMLKKSVYAPVDNPDLAFGETCFPVLPLVNAYIEDGEPFKIVAVVYDIPNCHANLAQMKDEIARLCAEKGAEPEYDEIVVPFDNSIPAVLNVYRELIKRVEDGDELYADITFGSKPMPIVIIMALQFAYRTKKDVSIEGVTYGAIEFHLPSQPKVIYDVTALVQLDELVRLMADSDVADPAGIIGQIIGE